MQQTAGRARFAQYRGLVAGYLLPQWRLSLLLVALMAGAIGLQLANPQILRHFIDTALSRGPISTLTTVALIFLAVAISTQIVAVAETYVAENIGWLATNRLRADLALHCLRLDMPFHGSYTPGMLIERIDGDVTALNNFFSRFTVYVLGNGLLLLGILAALFRVDWRIGGALTLLTVIGLGVVYRIRDIAWPQWNTARQASAELFGFIEERISGTEDIRSSGATAYTMRRLHERNRFLLRTMRRAAVTGTLIGWTTVLLYTSATVAALGIGVYLYHRHVITIGTVYLLFAYTQMLTRPIDEITRQLDDFQQAAASVGRIHALLDVHGTIPDGPGSALSAGPLSVEMEGVTFAYDETPVLNDVSFRLAAGRVMGVLGRTGSGKTTLSRLLFRLYDPQNGVVRLGGTDLRDVRVNAVRTRVGMVTQDIQLFHATVRDNLTLFDPSIPDQRIEKALRDLDLWTWCQGLPQGLDTMLISSGGLSAGESQLLAFARVFLKDPDLVVLDEASSRLDPATERRLERAVDRLLEGRTGIIIAHRLGTVRRVDEILILHDGEVVEWGDRMALEQSVSSRFARLLHAGLEEALV